MKFFGGQSFMFIKHTNVYIVAASEGNAQVAITFQFCNTPWALETYFGTIDEDSIRNNFVLIYELLDEVLDYGFPQNCTTDVLKMHITQQGNERDRREGVRLAGHDPGDRRDQLAQGGHQVPEERALHRRRGELQLAHELEGDALAERRVGRDHGQVLPLGHPECKFGLNDKLLLDNEAKAKKANMRRPGSGIEIDDVSFHQCVKLGKFDMDRTISFVRPDGEFQLMSYRISENVNLPFRVLPVVKQLGRTRLEINVKVKSMFTFKLFATNVAIKIPLPKNTAIAKVSAASGKCKYEPDQGGVIWKLRRFPGDTEYFMSGEVDMMATMGDKPWSRPPITMDFQVPMFAASGLHVRFLKVFEKSNYQTIKWVRYITKADVFTRARRPPPWPRTAHSAGRLSVTVTPNPSDAQDLVELGSSSRPSAIPDPRTERNAPAIHINTRKKCGVAVPLALN